MFTVITMKREIYLAENQENDQCSMFRRNLHRINNTLQYVNDYYTPNYKGPVDNEKRNNINDIENKVPNILDNQNKRKKPINFYTELYKITMNEIEFTRKTRIQKILNQKVNALEQKQKIYEPNNTNKKSIYLAANKHKSDIRILHNNYYDGEIDKYLAIENCTSKINLNNLTINNTNINHKSIEVKSELDNFSINENESGKLLACKLNIANTDISSFSFKIKDNKHKQIKNNTVYKYNDEYQNILENYYATQRYLKHFESLYVFFLYDINFKSLRQKLIIAINTPINSISSISPWYMKDKFDKLHALFMGKTVIIGNYSVSIESHKCALTFCKDTLAKNIVKIGERVVSIKTEVAFEVASVIVELWQIYPDFGMLLYARFKQTCPCLIPYTITKTINEADEEYYKLLGYNYTNGVVEEQDKYVIRMTGIIRLFAAIIVTKTISGRVLNVEQAWIIIATTLNIVPQLDITAILLYEMLTITGYYLRRAYGKQFIKMLKYIDTNYMKKIDEVTPIGFNGPVQRLKTFLSKVDKLDYYIDKPKGILPYSYW